MRRSSRGVRTISGNSVRVAAAEEAGGGLVDAFAEAFFEGPAGGGGLEAAGALEDDEAVARQRFVENGEELGGELLDLFVGRVDENEVVGCVAWGLPFGGVGRGDGCIQFFLHAFGDDLDVVADHDGGSFVEFYESGVTGAAAEGFEAVGAGAGEEVEAALVFDPGGGAGEDALAQLVHGGAMDRLIVDAERDAACFASGDAHLWKVKTTT